MLPNTFKPFKSSKKNLLRIGPNSDGGYVIDRRVINSSKTIISCGLNDDWEFEKSYLKKNTECRVIAYDHTINSSYWKKRFKKDFLSLILLKKLTINRVLDVFKYINYKFFFNNKNNIHYSKKIVLKKKNKNQMSMSEILSNQNNIILKIDIEGDEYSILKVINKDFNKINLLVIEFHNILKNLNKINKFLSNSYFKIIHLHANNYAGIDKFGIPKVIEFTLINSRKFKVNKKKTNRKYPITGLDYKNFKRRDDISLKFND